MMKRGLSRNIPLILDFDGTLHRGDMMWEAVAYALRHKPWALLVFGWLLLTQGRASAKLMLERVLPEVGTFAVAWNDDVRAFGLAEQAKGREVMVVSGSPEGWVESIVRAAGLDWEVMGTMEPHINLTKHNKAALLVKLFGKQGFDYAGNSADDLPVWAVAREAIVVNAPRAVVNAAVRGGNVRMEMVSGRGVFSATVRAMRPHQWLKNVLVFVPLLTAHQWGNTWALVMAAEAFVAFSLCASGVYVLNDMVDMQDDRAHSRKRARPLACGDMGVPLALAMVVVLTVLGFGVAWGISAPFAGVLAVYVATTLGYSFYLKTKPMADVVTLAGLYCLRVVAGAVAAGITLSFWLLLFALFGFYSLANMKRVIELRALVLAGKGKAKARGYEVDDTVLVAAQGSASGLMAVLVLALYLQSPAVAPLYSHPTWLGLICPLAMWWLARAWLIAWRGGMHDDPVVFAAKDGVSWLVALTVAVVMVGAV